MSLDHLAYKVNDELVMIAEVNVDESFLVNREISYSRRFGRVSAKSLETFDGESKSYGVYFGEKLMGGFRATPIGEMNSEVEQLFRDLSFKLPAIELGRFWVDPVFQRLGFAHRVFSLLFAPGSPFRQKNVYLKTATYLGVATTEFGFIQTGHSVLHSRLNYETTLFFRPKDPDFEDKNE